MAAGPWATTVAARIEPQPPVPKVDLVQGTHVELPGELQSCFYLEAPQDARAVFALPWKGHTLVGTTERFHDRPPEDTKPTEKEVEYLLAVFRHYFPGRSTERVDQWAGLRVLPTGTGTANKRSRETQLPVDNEPDAAHPVDIRR